jgi:membrane associated rhomboid family serine protease
MSEVSMWLYPVALAGAIGLFFGIRYGCRWTWGMCLQQLLILLCASIGLLALYFPRPFALGGPPETVAAGWAIGSWVLFACFNFAQRLVINQLGMDLSLFRIAQARARLPLVRALVWGPPAAYWQSAVEAMDLYSQGQTADGDAVLTGWWRDKTLPGQTRESLIGFLMLGRVLQHDWRGIVDLFLKYANLLAGSRSIVPFQMAMRACAELGEFEKALAMIDHGNLAANRVSTTTLDINFMTFFSLCGALEHLQNIFLICADKQALPEYVRSYWLGRCYGFRGDCEQAMAALSKAKSITPKEMHLWHERIDKQLLLQEQIHNGLFDAEIRMASDVVVEKAHELYSRWRLASDLLRPARARIGVVSIVISVCVAFLLTSPDTFLGGIPQLHSMLDAWHRAVYALGELSMPGLQRGEWWRAISYMFFHGNSAHLLLNAGALYLFGRSVENIYGTPKFFIIYFGSGILSGVAQVALMPQDSAIGASGAILGVFGAAIAGMIKLKDVIPAPSRKSELRWMLSIAVSQVIFDQLINGVAAMTDKTNQGVRIASFAHLGGMVAGFAIAMLLPTRKWVELSADPLAKKEAQSPQNIKPASDSDINPAPLS